MIIVLTGIDGSGKTTCALILAELLKSTLRCKVKVIYAGNTGLKLGKKYSFYLSLPIDIIIHRIMKRDHSYIYVNYPKLARLETLLLYLNYLLLVTPKVILSSKLYDVVITDRYIYDLVISRAVVNANVRQLTHLLYRIMPKPDLTILLDVDEHIAYIRKHREKKLHELKLLRKIYTYVAEKHGWIIVNANKTLNSVLVNLWNIVSTKSGVSRG